VAPVVHAPVTPVVHHAPAPAAVVSTQTQTHSHSHSHSHSNDAVVAALYPFNALRDHDLSLRAGDVIVNVNKKPIGGGNGNWWEGKNIHTGAVGAFPSNYVKELTSGERGIVLFSYTATRQDELSISAQQPIEILLRRDSGWWLARVGSQLGLVPYNYIQLS
jgi:hypothetical protein